MRKLATNTMGARVAQNEHERKVLEGVEIWAGYYRSNIHRFVEDYFHVHLKLFQIILLVMMNVCTTFVFVACRGLGKSFLSAIFCCARCILYPGQIGPASQRCEDENPLNCWKALRAV